MRMYIYQQALAPAAYHYPQCILVPPLVISEQGRKHSHLEDTRMM